MLDSFAAKYKFPMKSRRWYTYIFWHTIILAVINAWLLYKRDCTALKIPKKKVLNRRLFQAQLASSLILINAARRGQPSSASGSPLTSIRVTPQRPVTAQRRLSLGNGSPSNGVPGKRACKPPTDVRRDMVAHFPGKTTRGRCRHCVKGYSNTLCRKCNLRLCFSEERNCFWDYHCK